MKPVDIATCVHPGWLLSEARRLREFMGEVTRDGYEPDDIEKIELERNGPRYEAVKIQLQRLNWDDLRGFHPDIVYRVMKFTIEELYIETKDGEQKKFVLNSSQRRLLARVAKRVARGYPVKIRILKARQIGFSTLVEALIYIYFSRNIDGMNSTILAHKDNSTSVLLQMFNHYHANDPLAHEKDTNNRKGLTYKDRRGSLKVETGKIADGGRAHRINAIHFSEAAFYQNPDELIPGMLPSVPKLRPYTMIIMETTANGAGGYFYENWCVEQVGWLKFFVPWYEHDEYTMPFRNNIERAQFEKNLTDDDRTLMEAYPAITLEKLHWYKFVLDEEHKTDPDKMKQEYPVSEEEAFLYGGRPVFQPRDTLRHKAFIKNHYGKLEAPTYEVDISTEFHDMPGDGIFNKLEIGGRTGRVIKPVKDGRLTIFQRPRPGKIYCVGVDIADGIELGTVKDSKKSKKGESKTDDTVIKIGMCPYLVSNLGNNGDVRYTKPRDVAVWRGKIETFYLAKLIYILCVWYNNAFLGIEANRNGTDVISRVRKQYGYPNYLFLHHIRRINEGGNRITEQEILGWLTTSANRLSPLINDIIEDVMEDLYEIHDMNFLEEAQTFIYDKNGKPIHQAGRHDDNIFATAIMRQTMRIKWRPSVVVDFNETKEERFFKQLEELRTSKSKVM